MDVIFSSADKVPGAYGAVIHEAGGQSTGVAQLILLLVGLSSGGNLALDTEVRQVTSVADVDIACLPGSELARMAYGALFTSPDVQVWLAAPTPSGGATASTVTITITGAVTSGGSLLVRIGGYVVSQNFQASVDTPSTIASNLANAINGADDGHLPLSASASGPVVTLQCKSPGIRGNQHVVFIDQTQMQGTGITASLGGTTWAATTAYSTGAAVVPTVGNGFYFVATVGGTSSGSQPVWPTTIGATVGDGSVTWKCVGQIVTGGGATLSQGVGTENYTNLLATIAQRTFDRIGLAANDSVSLGAWLTTVNTDAGPLIGELENVVFATNGTLSAIQSLTQTTLNSARFQGVWQLNSESHPARIAGVIAALRASAENQDPAHSYDSVGSNGELAAIVAQSQVADWPSHATLVSALNTGVTPLFTTGDGQARIVRSITTHCLNGANPDYSVLDTAQSSCPDFMLKFFEADWRNNFQPANPRLQPLPAVSGDPTPLPQSGVGCPLTWNSRVIGWLKQMEAGTVPGTCPPIIISVDQNPPVSQWNYQSKAIISEIPAVVAPGDHQIGIAIHQRG